MSPRSFRDNSSIRAQLWQRLKNSFLPVSSPNSWTRSIRLRNSSTSDVYRHLDPADSRENVQVLKFATCTHRIMDASVPLKPPKVQTSAWSVIWRSSRKFHPLALFLHPTGKSPTA